MSQPPTDPGRSNPDPGASSGGGYRPADSTWTGHDLPMPDPVVQTRTIRSRNPDGSWTEITTRLLPTEDAPGKRRSGKPRRRRSERYRLGRIFLVIGIVTLLALGTAAVLVAVAQHRPAWVSVQGTVTDTGEALRYSEASDQRKVSYSPSADYRTIEGQALTCQGGTYSTSTEYFVGDPVEVIYDPVDPEDCRVDPGGGAWVPWMLAGMGLAFGASFGGFGVTQMRRPRR
ncbi:DUF3592 domain-containing protein [Naumannella halotolerans]|uniref:Uncharacterized protein DUF3592 n=1 Tax=Naumannella halotolerans TaxID=993414 RepID=A0A4R7J958_9ACTN|nr:DUF3592 domain-containing protein [Naumannella halotolerans]TDT33834.1 uncharacterized protein DUF3592 [Naumannella halotolerans]